MPKQLISGWTVKGVPALVVKGEFVNNVENFVKTLNFPVKQEIKKDGSILILAETLPKSYELYYGASDYFPREEMSDRWQENIC